MQAASSLITVGAYVLRRSGQQRYHGCTDKMQTQFDEMKKQFDKIQESHRLFSPEHIVHAIGYSNIKDDLKEIKKALGVH